MLRFLSTKIGLSIVVALVVMGSALTVRLKTSAPEETVASKVGLIADRSVERAIKSGQLDETGWEETLKNLYIGTTTDEIIKNLEEKASAAGTSTKELTATDRFAREFFSQYVKLQKSGVTIDENTGVELANKLLFYDYGGPIGEKVYMESDIKLAGNTSLSETKKYGNTVGTIFDEPLPEGYENEIVIVNRVYETGEGSDLQKLAQNIARYGKIRDSLAFVIVPPALKNSHLSMLNSLSAMIEGVRGMNLLETDPVGAVKMILRYENGVRSLELGTEQLITYFKKHNIVFSSAEPGYIFTE